MTKLTSIPEGYQTIMPYLILNNASGFALFMRKVFGAVLKNKVMRDENIIMHAELDLGGSTLMFADATEVFPVQTAGLFIYVDDADLTYKKSLEAGATVVRDPSDQPYGRSAGITDPYGNTLWITSIDKKS